MLSRVADSIYWMERYLERADNTARFLDVNKSLSLDFEANTTLWESLVQTSGSVDLYNKLYSNFDPENVVNYLTFDENNPNSILNCLRCARDNARSIRDCISEGMWEVVNSMYFLIKDNQNNKWVLQEPTEMIHTLKLRRMTYIGLMNNTMLLQEAFHHACIGKYLERADMTSRILDVKYYTILPPYAQVGSAIDTNQWAALLESTDSQEMYLKEMGTISPKKVASFLIFCKYCPRSIFYCLTKAQFSLHEISNVPVGTYKLKSERMIGKMCSSMSYITVADVIMAGLHEYLDDVQTKITRISKYISEEYYMLTEDKEENKQHLLETHE